MTPIRNRSLAVAAIGSTVLAVSMLGLPSQAATSGGSPRAHASNPRGGDATVRTPGYYDVRQLSGTALVKSERQQVATRTKADKVYYRSLGHQAVVDMDPLTHTARDFGRLDGYLTGRSSASARTIALNYVRAHAGELGLKKGDLATLRFRQDYVDAAGVHNLSWNQSVRGATVFGNGLKVKVTHDGRVLAVQGSPVSGLAALAAAAPSATKVGATGARSIAARNVDGSLQKVPVSSARAGTSTWANNDYAKRVWFLTPNGLRPGWSTYVQTSRGAYQHVVDAVTGKVLFRHSNSDLATGDALVYDNYPGASKGGKAKVVNLVKKGWIGKHAPWLKGTSTWTWSDLNDNNFPDAVEKTPLPGTKHGAQFTLKPFNSSTLCSAKFVCTWDPDTAFSWRKNRLADATQAFYLASNFHDYLSKAPISFTKKAGNFSTDDGDQVLLNALDGANVNGDGFPDGNHIDNANMSTPPDGISPTMQMYLWHAPFTTDDPATGDPFVPTSSAFDASVEYHEYTHGLSNRLVIDANGNSTLNDIQAGAMGEAWSDYYAMDYLVSHGFVKDTKASGEVLEGKYLMANKTPFRTMAIDCAVGQNVKNCQNPGVKNGGYTYGDFPAIGGGPEVHASGEVWAQTLWDIRKQLGHKVADTVITRGMSLSADDPTMLDMRDAILRADLVAFDRAHTDALWKIFAHRGMGFFAGAIDAKDTTPGEDFHVPPVHNPHDGVVAGTVTDPTTGQPVPGAVVQVTGQGDQYTTTTDANGQYAIFNLVTGTYAKVAASGAGYIGDAHAGTAVSIGDFNPGTDTTDFEIVRDWAAASGGGAVAAFDGPDFTPFGCGPVGAIDLSLSSGWGSTTGDNDGTPTNVFIPKALTIQLPQAIDISNFGVDPTATCGDGGSASTGAYEIETSTDGVNFVVANEGAFTVADRGQLNSLPVNAGTGDGVKFVRLTIKGNQTPDFANNCPGGAFSGCSFTDLTELAVFGSPTS